MFGPDGRAFPLLSWMRMSWSPTPAEVLEDAIQKQSRSHQVAFWRPVATSDGAKNTRSPGGVRSGGWNRNFFLKLFRLDKTSH